jgi:hypothetical protein
VASNADHHIRSHCVCQRRVVCVTKKWVCTNWRDFRGESSHRGNLCTVFMRVRGSVGRQVAGGLVLEKPRTDGR